MKTILMTAAALGAIATATSAQAAISTISFQSTAYNFTLGVDTMPAPATSGAGYFYIAPVLGTFNGNAFNFNHFAFTAQPDYTAGFTYNGIINEIFGNAQLFSGATSAPTLLAGVYNLTRANGTTGVLTISSDTGAVPEPATWAMMTLGFAAMGLAMRRKKVSTRIRFA